MRSYQDILKYLADFLSEKELLVLRLTSKTNTELLRSIQQAPYDTRIKFTVAVSGIFYDKKYFNCAWTIYHSVMTSASVKPAILYKLKDVNELKSNGTLNQFADGEDLSKTGRIYSPGMLHTWSVNAMWVKAITDKGKQAFVIYAKLSLENMLRSKVLGEPSAFLKEVAMAMKAGYVLDMTDDLAHVQLIPHPNAVMNTLNPLTMQAGKEEISKTMDAVMEMDKKREDALLVIKLIYKQFESIFDVSYSSNKLRSLQKNIANQLAQLVDRVFTGNVVTVGSFVRAFNHSARCPIKLCVNDSSLTLFDKTSGIAKVKADLIAAAMKEIDGHMASLSENKSHQVTR